MIVNDITQKEKIIFNELATHPLQSFEWGEFREKTGVKVIRKGFFEGEKLVSAFQLTIHKIPHTSWTIGYLPKGVMPSKEVIEELKLIAKKEKCIFIQLEPNVISSEKIYDEIKNLGLIPSAHPLFTKFSLQIDLQLSEENLLKNMHPKTRYNIKVAQKHEVTVTEETSTQAFNDYLKLTTETTTRQGFFAHTQTYHKIMWQTLQKKVTKNELSAHLFIAKIKDLPLTTWILFVFKDMLYYPYGASSSEHREAMSSTLMMWEAIKYGKKLGLKTFDLWGSLGPTPDPKDPWFGFHRFKTGFGPSLVEFAGSFDLVTNPLFYQLYKVSDKLRWLLLRLRR